MSGSSKREERAFSVITLESVETSMASFGMVPTMSASSLPATATRPGSFTSAPMRTRVETS